MRSDMVKIRQPRLKGIYHSIGLEVRDKGGSRAGTSFGGTEFVRKMYSIK